MSKCPPYENLTHCFESFLLLFHDWLDFSLFWTYRLLMKVSSLLVNGGYSGPIRILHTADNLGKLLSQPCPYTSALDFLFVT